MLRPMIHDVGDDHAQGRLRRGTVALPRVDAVEVVAGESLHKGRETFGLLGSERPDAREVRERGHLPLVRIVDVVPEEELSPTVVHDDEVTKGLRDAPLVQGRTLLESLAAERRDRVEDLRVGTRVVTDQLREM